MSEHKLMWAPYDRFMPFSQLEHRIRDASEAMGEAVTGIVPCFEMRKDGPALTSICMTTENYLYEVRMNSRVADFDVVLRRTIYNYRVQIGDVAARPTETKQGDEEDTNATTDPIRYQVAEIQLLHNLPSFKSLLTYVGDDVESWMKLVFDAIPIATLAQCGMPIRSVRN